MYGAVCDTSDDAWRRQRPQCACDWPAPAGMIASHRTRCVRGCGCGCVGVSGRWPGIALCAAAAADGPRWNDLSRDAISQLAGPGGARLSLMRRMKRESGGEEGHI